MLPLLILQGQRWKLIILSCSCHSTLGCNKILQLLTKPHSAESWWAQAAVQPASSVPCSVPLLPNHYTCSLLVLSTAAGHLGFSPWNHAVPNQQNTKLAPGWKSPVQQSNGLKIKQLRTSLSWRSDHSTSRSPCHQPVHPKQNRLQVFPSCFVFNSLSWTRVVITKKDNLNS